jgi:hypothetical protein
MRPPTTAYYGITFPYGKLFTLCLVFVLIFGMSCQLHSSEMNSVPKVGGPCEYKDYKGKAEIVSIEKKGRISDSAGNKQPDELFKITYHFYPEMKIQETFVHDESNDFVMLLPDSSYPDLGFIQRNTISIGKRFDCVLKVITKGACKPIIFKFPTLK